MPNSPDSMRVREVDEEHAQDEEAPTDDEGTQNRAREIDDEHT